MSSTRNKGGNILLHPRIENIPVFKIVRSLLFWRSLESRMDGLKCNNLHFISYYTFSELQTGKKTHKNNRERQKDRERIIIIMFPASVRLP